MNYRNGMQKQLDIMQQDIKEVKEALLGGEYNKNGLLQRMAKVEKYQEKEKKYKWLIAGGATTIAFLSRYWEKLTDIL